MESSIVAHGAIIALDLMVAVAIWLNYRNSLRSYLAYAAAAAMVDAFRQTCNLVIGAHPDISPLFFLSGFAQYLSTLLFLIAWNEAREEEINISRILIGFLTLFVAMSFYFWIAGFTNTVSDWYLYYLPLLLVSSLLFREWMLIDNTWIQVRGFLFVCTAGLVLVRFWIPAHRESGELFYLTYYLEAVTYPIALGTMIVYAMEETHRKVQELLAQRVCAERDLQFILDRSADSILVTNESGVFTTWNIRSEEQFGFTAQEAIGKLKIWDLLTSTHQLPEPAESIEIEDVAQRKDGSNVTVRIRAQASNRDGEKYCVYVIQDLSKENELKRQNQIFEQRLQQSQKLESLGVLAGGIAHDFNNLLATIMGYAGIAQADDVDKLNDHLDHILLASEKASQLTEQMLTYAGQGPYDPSPMELNKTIEDMIPLLVPVIAPNAKLEFFPGDEDVWLMGEASQIDQIVMNLVMNASESLEGKAGAISIRTGRWNVNRETLNRSLFGNSMEPGEYAFMKINDSGSGMDAETQAHLFDPFFSTKFTGRGLGMATVAGITKRHNAAINVNSKLNSGTNFVFYFKPCEKLLVETAANEVDSSYAVKKTILILDDDEDLLRMCQEMLEFSGFKVITMQQGEAALSCLEEQPDIDVLVFDCTLPGRTGPELYAQLLEKGIQIPVVFFSGYTEGQVSGGISPEWAVEFLHKPFRQNDLLRAVGNLLVPRDAGEVTTVSTLESSGKL
ncbi:MAG: response regulator [bacterium]|nr:response regulator [Gammaproteobacteria bacterium]